MTNSPLFLNYRQSVRENAFIHPYENERFRVVFPKTYVYKYQRWYIQGIWSRICMRSAFLESPDPDSDPSLMIEFRFLKFFVQKPFFLFSFSEHKNFDDSFQIIIFSRNIC